MMEVCIYASNHHEFGSHTQVNVSSFLCMRKYTCVNHALTKSIILID